MPGLWLNLLPQETFDLAHQGRRSRLVRFDLCGQAFAKSCLSESEYCIYGYIEDCEQYNQLARDILLYSMRGCCEIAEWESKHAFVNRSYDINSKKSAALHYVDTSHLLCTGRFPSSTAAIFYPDVTMMLWVFQFWGCVLSPACNFNQRPYWFKNK